MAQPNEADLLPDQDDSKKQTKSSCEEAKAELNQLMGVVQQMKKEQQGNSKFTERQLNKANKQLDKLNSTPNALTKENTFQAVASIGNNLRLQGDNLKSGDPVKITSGTLSLVSGVAMCFGPTGMAIGAVTGLVAGVMQIFSSTPKPTMGEVIQDMITTQTKQIANMLEEVTEHINAHIDAKFQQLSEQIKQLAKNIKNEFIEQKRFNEKLVAQSDSSGALQVLLNNISYLNGFIEQFDENVDKDTINSQIDRLLSQITMKDGVSEIGHIKTKIQHKLEGLNQAYALNEQIKQTEEYYVFHNYTIRMIVSLINVYVILNTYRYMILFQLANLLYAAGDKPNGNAMQHLCRDIKTEGEKLLSFIAKPSFERKYEMIISGYIRASKNAKTIDEYLRFCTSKAVDFHIDTSKVISLCDAIPKFNPHNLYAIRNKNDHAVHVNHIFGIIGVDDMALAFINEHYWVAFINRIAAINLLDVADIKVRNKDMLMLPVIDSISLYFQLKSDKAEPWRISVKGFGISTDEDEDDGFPTGISTDEHGKIVWKKKTDDYPLILLSAIPTSNVESKSEDFEQKVDESKSEDDVSKSTIFMLMNNDDPGDFLTVSDPGNKMLEYGMQFSSTKNFQTNYAMFTLMEPKAPIK